MKSSESNRDRTKLIGGILVILLLLSFGWWAKREDAKSMERFLGHAPPPDVWEGTRERDSAHRLLRSTNLATFRVLPESQQLERFAFLQRYLPADNLSALDSLRPLVAAIAERRATVTRREGSAKAPIDPRRAAAQRVLTLARGLCKIYEESPHLVVECDQGLGNGDRLGFARSIADADAALTGQARSIYFYERGREFARADGLNGIRLVP
jgi:hypothetical protein